MPGILTGGAALLTAVVATGGFWRATEKDNGSGGTRTVTVVRTLAEPVIDEPAVKKRKTGTTARKTPATPKPGNVLRSGQATLGNVDNFTFMTGQVGHGYAGDLGVVGIDPKSDYDAINSLGDIMAVSTGPNTKAGCAKALNARRVGKIPHYQLPGGTLVCVILADGNIASMRIIRPIAIGHPKVTFAYTVWK